MLPHPHGTHMTCNRVTRSCVQWARSIKTMGKTWTLMYGCLGRLDLAGRLPHFPAHETTWSHQAHTTSNHRFEPPPHTLCRQVDPLYGWILSYEWGFMFLAAGYGAFLCHCYRSGRRAGHHPALPHKVWGWASVGAEGPAWPALC